MKHFPIKTNGEPVLWAVAPLWAKPLTFATLAVQVLTTSTCPSLSQALLVQCAPVSQRRPCWCLWEVVYESPAPFVSEAHVSQVLYSSVVHRSSCFRADLLLMAFNSLCLPTTSCSSLPRAIPVLGLLSHRLLLVASKVRQGLHGDTYKPQEEQSLPRQKSVFNVMLRKKRQDYCSKALILRLDGNLGGNDHKITKSMMISVGISCKMKRVQFRKADFVRFSL